MRVGKLHLATPLLPGVDLSIGEGFLHVESALSLQVVSSAAVGGDLVETRHILGLQVSKDYSNPFPEEDLLHLADDRHVFEPFVGLMTAVPLQKARIVGEEIAETKVVAIVTVGLGNAIAAGKSPPRSWQPGTINMILLLEASLTRGALVNAVVTATEAKTLALVDLPVLTPEGFLASGTSTDAVVVASTGRGSTFSYAGPGTEIGWLIGRAVRRAISGEGGV
jgi:iron complex transport system ATP-binding protein